MDRGIRNTNNNRIRARIMNTTDNDTAILLVISWVNYIISHLLQDAMLNKVALILTIIGSFTYIILNIKKIFTNEKGNSND